MARESGCPAKRAVYRQRQTRVVDAGEKGVGTAFGLFLGRVAGW